ncbi:hypothetical protein [Terriglobus albidus]|uniref:hypothetical protein n=1 Tax=Terriglobus albidus TaxID=1592106 RepID=UPI0021E00F0D|nr:hypothetical protein [Terriglobus albidus]
MLNSSVINAAVLYALLTSGSEPNCVKPLPENPMQPQIQQQQVQSQALASQVATPKRPIPFSAPGRLDVAAPAHNLKLAEENEITFRPRVAGLTEVETEQLRYVTERNSSVTLPFRPEGGWAKVPLLYHPDGSASIKVTPRLLGRLALRIVARFPDGGVTNSEIMLNVEPPNRSPEKLTVGDSPWVRTFLGPKEPVRFLPISAIYKNVKEEVTINPAFASFHVRSENNASPAIAIDPARGMIKPLGAGEALVETSFGGWTNLTCVIVKENRESSFRNEGCKLMLRPGETVGMSIRK